MCTECSWLLAVVLFRDIEVRVSGVVVWLLCCVRER